MNNWAAWVQQLPCCPPCSAQDPTGKPTGHAVAKPSALLWPDPLPSCNVRPSRTWRSSPLAQLDSAFYIIQKQMGGWMEWEGPLKEPKKGREARCTRTWERCRRPARRWAKSNALAAQARHAWCSDMRGCTGVVSRLPCTYILPPWQWAARAAGIALRVHGHHKGSAALSFAHLSSEASSCRPLGGRGDHSLPCFSRVRGQDALLCRSHCRGNGRGGRHRRGCHRRGCDRRGLHRRGRRRRGRRLRGRHLRGVDSLPCCCHCRASGTGGRHRRGGGHGRATLRRDGIAHRLHSWREATCSAAA